MTALGGAVWKRLNSPAGWIAASSHSFHRGLIQCQLTGLAEWYRRVVVVIYLPRTALAFALPHPIHRQKLSRIFNLAYRRYHLEMHPFLIQISGVPSLNKALILKALFMDPECLWKKKSPVGPPPASTPTDTTHTSTPTTPTAADENHTTPVSFMNHAIYCGFTYTAARGGFSHESSFIIIIRQIKT